MLRTRTASPRSSKVTAAASSWRSRGASGGFGYDPLFLSDDLGKTFGEATGEEKDRISHRGQALAHLVEKLKSHP